METLPTERETFLANDKIQSVMGEREGERGGEKGNKEKTIREQDG